MSGSPALVILAAGESARMGRCKALLPLPGGTPLEHLCAAGACFRGAPPLVITGAHHEEIAARAPPGAVVLFNPLWSAGRTGGLHLAAKSRPGLDLCVAPVDVPLVPASVFESLHAAWLEAGLPARGWLAPAFTPPGSLETRFGHPVLAGRELLLELDGWSPDTPLQRLRELAQPLFSVRVDTSAVLDDLDTPEDFHKLGIR